MFWLIPVVGAVLAAVCASIGASSALRALRALHDHADRLQAATPLVLVDSARLETALGRIDRSLDGTAPLLGRAAAAVREVGAGIGDLRLREAMVALRVVGVAIRALRRLH